MPDASRCTSSAFSILLADSSTALSWGAALGRQRPLYAEGLEHQVDLGVAELAAAVRVEHLDVRDGEGGRRERRLDQPGVFPGPGGVAGDLSAAGVDEQTGVVPRGPDAHVGQVAAYMGARRPAAEVPRATALGTSASLTAPGCTLNLFLLYALTGPFSLMMRQTRCLLTVVPDL